MSEASRVEPETGRRRIGLFSASTLVVANMIGVGVFTTSGFALADLHSRRAVLIAWGVGGVLALCGAICYGALARAIPESGGEYTLLTRTVHPAAGILGGWVSLLAGFSAPIAAAALGVAVYAESIVESAHDPRWIGSGVIVFAGAMHAFRFRGGLIGQNVVVWLKIGLLLALIATGLARIDWAGAAADARGDGPAGAFDLGAFAVTLIWISFAFSGWNAAVYIAGEVRKPRTNLPKSLVIATVLVGVFYVALNGVLLHAAPIGALAGRENVAAVAAEQLGGRALSTFVSAIIVLALFTSVSSMVMIGPRVYAKMAGDGCLPRWFATWGDAPARAIGLQVLFALVIVWISGLERLLGYLGFTLGLSTALTVVGLMLLRRRLGRTRVPVFGFPLVPIVFITATVSAAVYMAMRRPIESAFGLATLVVPISIYILMGRRRAGRGDSARAQAGNGRTGAAGATAGAAERGVP